MHMDHLAEAAMPVLPAVFKQLAALPRSRQPWQFAALPAPAVIRGVDEPWLLLCVQADGLVRTVNVIGQAPTLDDWEKAFVAACKAANGPIRPAQPSAVQVRDEEAHAALARCARLSGGQLELVAELPALAAVAADLDRSMDRRPAPLTNASLRLRLWTAAARFAEMEAWRALDDEVPVRFELEERGWERPVATVLGNARSVFGFSLYRSEAAWQTVQRVSAYDSGPGTQAVTDAIVVWFSPPREIVHAIRKDAERAGLPIATGRFPTFVRIEPGHEPQLASKTGDLRALAAALEAFAGLWREHGDTLNRFGHRKVGGTYPTQAGAVQVDSGDIDAGENAVVAGMVQPLFKAQPRYLWAIVTDDDWRAALPDVPQPSPQRTAADLGLPVVVLVFPKATARKEAAALDRLDEVTLQQVRAPDGTPLWVLFGFERGVPLPMNVAMYGGPDAVGWTWPAALEPYSHLLVAVAGLPANRALDGVPFADFVGVRLLAVRRQEMAAGSAR